MNTPLLWTRRSLLATAALAPAACAAGPAMMDGDRDSGRYLATTEFEAQDTIWVTWGENGFLGGEPMTETLVPLIREISPHVRVRILYNQWTSWLDAEANPETTRTPEEMRARISTRLTEAGVNLARIDFQITPMLFGAIQDPGPVFLRRQDGDMQIADFASRHFDPKVGYLDRELVAPMGLAAISSQMKCDAGNRQCNGRGVLMVGGAFAQRINPEMSRAEMEAEYRRVQGVEKVIWLNHGPREEDFDLLEDGRWGIGTGGHIDEFCRFVDARTVILSEVPEAERTLGPVLAETHRRMEENLAILQAARDVDGNPFRILRAPLPQLMTFKLAFDDLNPFEKYWFEGPGPGDEMEFYLPGSYTNFVVANEIVVTSSYWREGMDEQIRLRDEEGLAAIQAAFPDRRVVQIHATPLLHDGAGIHCYTRNQPVKRAIP